MSDNHVAMLLGGIIGIAIGIVGFIVVATIVFLWLGRRS